MNNEDGGQKITAVIKTLNNYKAVYVTCNQTIAMKNGFKNISRRRTLSSGEIIMGKCSEIERK